MYKIRHAQANAQDSLSIKPQKIFEFDWQGSLSLKNNYVFSTGTEIDDNPVAQLWLRGYKDNGLFVEVWSNLPLDPDNVNRSAEIDYAIGYRQNLKNFGELTTALYYYDIQTPDIFNFNNDAWGPGLMWQYGKYTFDGLYFFVDGAQDGFRLSNAFTQTLNTQWSITPKLNYADGPFQSQAVVVGKLNIAYRNPRWWLESFSLEFSEILYAADPNEVKGFATTFAVTKELF